MTSASDRQPHRRATPRYDGIADWYNEYLDDMEGHYSLVRETLVELAGKGQGRCLDVACGVGYHMPSLAQMGWTMFGLDFSGDMLRVATGRATRLVRADAAFLPVETSAIDLVVSSYSHTDFDDFGPVVSEIARVLRTGGRFVYVGPHPCFVGPFAERRGDDEVLIHPGYRDTAWRADGPGISGRGVRDKVGVRHVPLEELFNKVARAGLRLDRFLEPGEEASPWLLGFEATKR